MNLKAFLDNKVIKNAGWLVIGTFAQKVLAFFVGVISARYLGPANYGLVNYAAAYITFFASICTLGINSIIIKEFVDYPEEEGTAIGTTLVLRAVSSFVSAIMIVGIVAIVDNNEPITIAVTALSCLSLPLQVFDTLKKWFQLRLQSKYVTIAALIAYAVMASYKILLLLNEKTVLWFAISSSIEHIVVATILLVIYCKQGGQKFCYSWKKAKKLLSCSKSYIASGLMISIYASTDKLMLKQMLSESSVGYYTLAVSISTMFAFVLSAVIDSLNPGIVRTFKEDVALFDKKNKQLYAIVFYGAMAMSAVITVFSKWIITLLYGVAYYSAVEPLRIVVWYTAFSYLGVARDIWVVCNNKQKYLKYLYASAAMGNVLLNAVLIPRWGTVGAAVASLITQILTSIVLPMCIPALRKNAKLMLEAICLRRVFN